VANQGAPTDNQPAPPKMTRDNKFNQFSPSAGTTLVVQTIFILKTTKNKNNQPRTVVPGW